MFEHETKTCLPLLGDSSYAFITENFSVPNIFEQRYISCLRHAFCVGGCQLTNSYQSKAELRKSQKDTTQASMALVGIWHAVKDPLQYCNGWSCFALGILIIANASDFFYLKLILETNG